MSKEFDNIPRDVAIEARNKYTERQLELIDRKLYLYFAPDWSEETFAEIWEQFDATLELEKRGGTDATSTGPADRP